MKALEKIELGADETANGLATDVKRYLNDEAVTACPPSAVYTFRKFARRNKTTLCFSALVFTGLMLAVTAMAISNRMISQREADKNAAIKQSNADLAFAQEQEKYARAIADFLKHDFLALTSVDGQMRSEDESLGLTKDSSLKELIDRAAMKLNTRIDLNPRVEADLRWTIGESYAEMGEVDQSLSFLKRSLELHRELYGDEADSTLKVQTDLGMAHLADRSPDQALLLFHQVLKIRKAKQGENHDDTLVSMLHVGHAYLHSGERDVRWCCFRGPRGLLV